MSALSAAWARCGQDMGGAAGGRFWGALDAPCAQGVCAGMGFAEGFQARKWQWVLVSGGSGCAAWESGQQSDMALKQGRYSHFIKGVCVSIRDMFLYFLFGGLLQMTIGSWLIEWILMQVSFFFFPIPFGLFINLLWCSCVSLFLIILLGYFFFLTGSLPLFFF